MRSHWLNDLRSIDFLHDQNHTIFFSKLALLITSTQFDIRDSGRVLSSNCPSINAPIGPEDWFTVDSNTEEQFALPFRDTKLISSMRLAFTFNNRQFSNFF